MTHDLPVATGPGSTDVPAGSGPSGTELLRLRRRLLVTVPVVAVAVPAALAVAGGERWWRYIAPEQTPMTWAQSVVLVLAGATAMVLHGASRLRPAPSAAARRPVWWLLGAGLWLLALDERFAVHERVRDGLLAPRDVRVPLLPWVGPGDFLLLGVAVVGLLVLPRVLAGLTPDRVARRTFLTGVALAALAVTMDSLDPARMSLPVERWEQTLEECVELTVGLCLLAALVLRLLGRLADPPGRDG